MATSPAATAPPSLGPIGLAPILTIQFIGTLGYSIAIPLLVFVVSDLGGASWTYGVVGATYSLFQLFGAPLLGRWSDRSGRRIVLVVSQAGTFLAWLLFLVALALPVTSFGRLWGASLTLPLLVVFASRAFDGLTGGNVSVASAYVADLTVGSPQRRQAAFGQMGMAASLGFALGPALAGLLGGTAWGYTLPIAVAATISGLATALCAFALPETKERCPDGPPEQPAVTRVLGHQHRRCDRTPPPRAPRVVRQPRVVALIGATFVLFLAFNFFYAGFPVHAEGPLGWGPGRMGYFFAVMSGAMIVAQGPLLTWVAKRIPAPVTFAAGMALLVAAFLLFLSMSEVLLFAGAIAFAFGNGLAWPTFQARLADVAGDGAQGSVQGAATSAGSVASILGMVAGGALYPAIGSWVFGVGALLFLAVTVLTPVWFRDGPAPPAADVGS
ncbi:MAG: MFS transporter [Sandaracinaceae bacterium]